MPELRGNKAIEDAAIAWVIELERTAGRTPRDTRYRGAPADIESPPRLIEVKAFGRLNRGFDLWLETQQVDEARTNPDFYVYVVENVAQGNPGEFTLKVLGGERLRALIAKAKERRYYTVPWPVADYDAAPNKLDAELVITKTAMLQTSTASAMQRPATGQPAQDPIVFDSGDDSYLRWISEHPTGWVINTTRTPSQAYLKLHTATCTSISRVREPGAYTERDYIKVCSTRRSALDEWARLVVGGRLDAGCPCT